MSKIVVHHLGISQSDRIVWLCEEPDIDYELRKYQRDSRTRLAPAEYRALTPFGTTPVINDGDLVLGESGAIIEYLIEIHGDGRLKVAPGGGGLCRLSFLVHFANGSLMPAAMIDMVAGMLDNGNEGVVGALCERLDRAHEQIEERLSQVDYLAGDTFTAADIISAFPLTTMRLFAPRDLAPYPNIRSYLSRIGERPAFRRAMVKADPGFEVPPS